jgi:GNAT superfamily N-acetyltransferase
MKAREYHLIESRNHKFVHEFVPWVAEQLGITELPKIKLLDKPIDTTFGQYDPETKSLSIVIADRNPIDVLRTLAHELTHHKQNLAGELTAGAGETGTPQENEANANAGVVMRDFAKANPEYFGLKKSGITEEAFNGIDISIEIQKDDEYVDDDDYDNQVMYVTATSNGRELGHVLFAFDGDELLPQDLEVDERYRGQGIAQTMYDYVKSKGYKIRRSGQQTDAGAGFWAKHRPKQNVWEDDVDEGKIIHPDRINLYLNLRRPNAKPIQIAHNIPYKAMDAVIAKLVSKYSDVEADMFEFRPARSLREEHDPAVVALLNKMNYRMWSKGDGEYMMTFKNTQLEFNSAGVFYNGPPVKGPNGVKPNFGIKWRHDPEWYSPRGEISFEHAWKMGLFPKIQGIYPYLQAMDKQGYSDRNNCLKIDQAIVKSAVDHVCSQNTPVNEDSVDDKKHHSELIDSLENWMAMEYNFQDIETILMSPESRPFTQPPAGVQWVYRAIVPRSRRLNSIKARGPVVAYATRIEGAIEFVRGLDTIDPWLIVRKPFNPADMLLDFTTMYETIVQPDAHSRYAVEHEVWMRSTPAYNKATKQEVVLTSAQYYADNYAESIDEDSGENEWNELSPKVSKDTNATPAIKDLQHDLKEPYSYDAIDHMMIAIAKKYNMTTHDLHLLFVDKVGTTPDVWIRSRGADPDKWTSKDIEENFADGKKPGRKGLAKRSGVNTKASVSSLRKTAKHSTGEKARMAHWLANMKAGKKKHAKEGVDEAVGEKKLVIFDIDDTLVTTNTRVGVVRNGKTVKTLDSHEFTLYKKQPGEEFDFGAFRDAEDFFKHAQPIAPMIEQLKNDIATGNKVVMVTARSDFNNKEIFLKTFEQWHIDMNKVHVYRAGNDQDPVPIDEKKARIIRRLLTGYPYNKAIMYDDSKPNLESFLKLHQEYPDIRFYAWHVDRNGHATEYARAVDESLFESEVANQVTDAVIDFYKDEVGEVSQQPVNNYVEQAQALLAKTDPSIRGQVKEILVKAKTNPYIQGGVITTIGTLLTGGLLHIAQNVQLSPAQTNMLLQAVLNTVIPTVVSRVNGKNWIDTVKYTLASAGIGVGIGAISEDEINEIENLQSYQYTGGKDVLKHPRYTDPDAVSRKNIKPLPGGSGLNYATIDHGRFLEIRMLDQSGQEAVGQLKLMRVGFPIDNAYQVSTITVDEDYRGQGIAKALYGVALSILKITLLAGSQQTPGGKRNWMGLAQIPGVEVRGYVELENSDLKYKKLHKQKNAKDLANAERRNAIVDKNIDIVMGRLGGDYLGEDEDGNMIFAFDVVPGTGSLTPAVKTELNKLYYGEYDMLYVTGLYAQWRGA